MFGFLQDFSDSLTMALYGPKYVGVLTSYGILGVVPRHNVFEGLIKFITFHYKYLAIL
jgi:hypothetical protein